MQNIFRVFYIVIFDMPFDYTIGINTKETFQDLSCSIGVISIIDSMDRINK